MRLSQRQLSFAPPMTPCRFLHRAWRFDRRPPHNPASNLAVTRRDRLRPRPCLFQHGAGALVRPQPRRAEFVVHLVPRHSSILAAARRRFAPGPAAAQDGALEAVRRGHQGQPTPAPASSPSTTSATRSSSSLTPEQFDRDYLLVTQLSQGIGELGLDGGTSLRSDLVRFHRAGRPGRALGREPPLRRRRPARRWRARWTTPSAIPSRTRSRSPRSATRGEPGPDRPVARSSLSDWADVGSTLQTPPAQRKLDRQPSRSTTSAPASRSSGSSRPTSRPRSGSPSRARATSGSRRSPTTARFRSACTTRCWSCRPPRCGPRYADERVGYFISAFKDFSRDTAESFFVRYVNRWRLEKRESGRPAQRAGPSDHLSTSTTRCRSSGGPTSGPASWSGTAPSRRPGYRNAIQVLDAPDDSAYSAADARYSTVRWTATNRSVYAVGPTNVDPRTGEILNADILISAAWIQTWRGESREYTSPVASVAVGLRRRIRCAGRGRRPSLLCRFGEGLDRQGTRRPRAARRARGDARRRRRAARVHRPGAQGAGHARGRAHARPAPQLPRLGRHHRGAAGGPRAHRARTATASR